MAVKRKKKISLVERIEETRAIQKRRDVTKRKLGWLARNELVQKDPSVVAAKYNKALQRMASLVLNNIKRGDLEGALGRVHQFENSMRNAFNRTLDQTRMEAQRLLGVKIPRDKHYIETTRPSFVLMQKARITRHIQRLPSIAPEKREAWFRYLMKLIANNEVQHLAKAEMARLSKATGSLGGIYHTRRDELVRPTHAIHDGKFYAWGQEPDTLQEYNCRCRMIPVEAGLVAE